MSSIPPPTDPPTPPSGFWGRVAAFFSGLAWAWGRVPVTMKHWIFATISTVIASILTAWIMHQPVQVIVPPLPPDTQALATGGTGWLRPTEEETTAAMAAISQYQGLSAEFGRAARAVMDATDDNRTVFFFDAEEKVLGKRLGAWNQGKAGTCVGEGYGRDVQDLLLMQIMQGAQEQWPGAQVATEPIYGGSRIEIGQGRLGRGDGSSGAWASQWVQKYGVLFRQKYGQYDLSSYSIPLSRSWGSHGVPHELEDEARKHPVQTVARVTSPEQLWAAIGNGYPVPICSNIGFDARPKTGVLEPAGEWDHCMACRGRFVHKTLGKCVVIQQSWGNYLNQIGVKGPLTVPTVDRGDVVLPEGCFAIRLAVAGQMVAQNDSFALSGLQGFPAQTINWIARKGAPHDQVYALAP